MPRTIHEIDLARQRLGACEVVGKLFVEEPLGSPHDAIVAAEAAAIARELEEAIGVVIARRQATTRPESADPSIESLLRRRAEDRPVT